MDNHHYERVFLEAAAPELKSYLLSEEVYWNIGVRAGRGMPPYPQFTLGWLLLFRRRAVVGEAAADLGETLASISALKARWRSAWARKAGREFSLRIKLWARFMNELRGDKKAPARRYAYEVQRRTILELLRDEAGELPSEEIRLLEGMDAALRAMLKPGSYLGPAAEAAAFPAGRFWFLYGDFEAK